MAWLYIVSCLTYTRHISRHWKSRVAPFFHGCIRYGRLKLSTVVGCFSLSADALFLTPHVPLELQLYHNLPEEFGRRLSFDEQEPSKAVRADHSFKLASEVALMIVFLFQCYPRLLQDNAEKLLPLMVKVCGIP